jgi:hypothetical protein
MSPVLRYFGVVTFNGSSARPVSEKRKAGTAPRVRIELRNRLRFIIAFYELIKIISISLNTYPGYRMQDAGYKM